MKNILAGPPAMITLPEVTVGKLMSLRSGYDETLAEVVERLMQAKKPAPIGNPAVKKQQESRHISSAKYACECLGVQLFASTLGAIFGEAVDQMAEIAPDALERLSGYTMTRRHHLSRERNGVHPGRPDLNVLKTRSGWWISGNVSLQQTTVHLRALCHAARLEFDKDIRFFAR